MDCGFCKASNDPDERRCVRCGRRLHSSVTRPAPDGYTPTLNAPIQTSTAPALERLSLVPSPEKTDPAKKEVPAPTREYQPFLFQEGLGSPKVVPIPTLPGAQKSRAQKTVQRGAAPPAARVRRTNPGDRSPQQDFEFAEIPSRAALDMQVEVICCDAPVALPAHRLIAGAADLSLILIGVGLFLGVFVMAGGEVVLTRQTVPALIGAVLGIGLFYRLLWCIGNVDTPGMRFAGLRLVDFDGRTPDREQRGRRQLAGMLSILSAGLGLIWAMVDEENLTWHDQISKTFPTPG